MTDRSGFVAVEPTNQPSWSSHFGCEPNRASRAASDVGFPAATPWSTLDTPVHSELDEQAGTPTSASTVAPAIAIFIMVVGGRAPGFGSGPSPGDLDIGVRDHDVVGDSPGDIRMEDGDDRHRDGAADELHDDEHRHRRRRDPRERVRERPR